MKIRFLGTGHGVPAPDRFCSCTIVEVNEAIYVIDAGAPLLDALLHAGKDPQKVKGIFVTHTHADHIAGLYGYLSTVNWFYKEASLQVFMPAQRECQLFSQLIEYAGDRPVDKNRIRWDVVQEGLFFEDENIRIFAEPTAHLKKVGRPSYSFLVEADGKKVVFTGDISQWLEDEDYPQAALSQETDMVICEFAHFTPEQIGEYMKKTRTKQFWFNHVGLSKKFDRFEAMKELGTGVPYPVLVACDGDEVAL